MSADPRQLELFADLPNRPGRATTGRARITAKGKKVYDIPRGFAARPGTGPAGETCGSCAHRCTISHGKNYQKCGLIRHRWTGGPATDIRLKSPACMHWEKIPAQP